MEAKVEHLFDTTNNTTPSNVFQEIPNSSLGESGGEGASKVQLVMFLGLTLINIIQNTRVIAIVVTMPRKRQRTGNLLIAHLSAITLMLNYVAATYMLKQWNLSLLAQSTGLCVANSYIRNLLVSLVPANVTAISYQQSTVFQPSYQGEKLLVGRSLCVIWIVATVGNLPVMFMVGLIPTGTTCLQHPFLGSLPLTVAYELIKLVVYNVAPMCYICYDVIPDVTCGFIIASVAFSPAALFQIKSKVSKYIFMTKLLPSTSRTRGKVQKLRLVFLNGLTFILLWLPAAVLLSLHKVFRRIDVPSPSRESTTVAPKTESSLPIYFCPMVIAYHVYFILHPLIHLHLNEDLSDIPWWSFRYTQHRKVQRPSPVKEDPQDKEDAEIGPNASTGNEIKLQDFNAVDPSSDSRVSTFAISTAASVTVHTDNEARSGESFSERSGNVNSRNEKVEIILSKHKELLV